MMILLLMNILRSYIKTRHVSACDSILPRCPAIESCTLLPGEPPRALGGAVYEADNRIEIVGTVCVTVTLLYGSRETLLCSRTSSLAVGIQQLPIWMSSRLCQHILEIECDQDCTNTFGAILAIHWRDAISACT